MPGKALAGEGNFICAGVCFYAKEKQGISSLPVFPMEIDLFDVERQVSPGKRFRNDSAILYEADDGYG